MPCWLCVLIQCVFLTGPTPAHAAADEAETEPVTAESPAPEPAPATPAAPTVTDAKRWFVILPAFVMHGIDPSGGANRNMPRRVTADGRFVATPGLGLEFQGHRSLEVALAFVKDCYDNPAGAIQVGQHVRVGTGWDFAYSVGAYVRETPIACLSTTVTTTILGRPGLFGTPSRINSLTTTRCAFQDNLPLRYTTRVGQGYMDVIPTPFLHASARLYHGPFDVYLKAISNFYLTEFGLTVSL